MKKIEFIDGVSYSYIINYSAVNKIRRELGYCLLSKDKELIFDTGAILEMLECICFPSAKNKLVTLTPAEAELIALDFCEEFVFFFSHNRWSGGNHSGSGGGKRETFAELCRFEKQFYACCALIGTETADNLTVPEIFDVAGEYAKTFGIWTQN
ncbi:hypothetical protein FACS189454_08680 [Planctomycetales bacterium]|nr:hypothetical protein FACS189454_08680 [Planctomycetales bacterium]